LGEGSVGALAGWSILILWAGVADAILQAIVGIAHIDREAIAFGVFFAVGAGILLRARQGSRVYAATVVILGLLFGDVAFWMITATWSNVRNHEQLLYIVEPLALASASVAGLIGVLGRLIDSRGRAARRGVAVVSVAALAGFTLCTGAAAISGWGKEQTQGPNDLALKIHNTAYSATNISAASHQVTLYVTNDTGNSLTAIDPRTGRPGRTIPVEDPYNMYFTPDGRYAIVVAERLRRLDFRQAHTMKLALEDGVVRELRERALARAGSSSTLNDLAVILSRALSERKPITLRRAESRALEHLLGQTRPAP